MFTIEEARITRPAVTRQIPRGATLEYSQETIHQALEEQNRRVGQTRVRFLSRQIDRAMDAVVTRIASLSDLSRKTAIAGQNGAD